MNKQLQELIGSLINKDYSSLTFFQTQNILNPFSGLNEIKMVPVETGEQEPTLNDLLLALDKTCLWGFDIKTLDVWLFKDYNLANSIFNQTEEVLTFIINLLTNENK